MNTWSYTELVQVAPNRFLLVYDRIPPAPDLVAYGPPLGSMKVLRRPAFPGHPTCSQGNVSEFSFSPLRWFESEGLTPSLERAGPGLFLDDSRGVFRRVVSWPVW